MKQLWGVLENKTISKLATGIRRQKMTGEGSYLDGNIKPTVEHRVRIAKEIRIVLGRLLTID